MNIERGKQGNIALRLGWMDYTYGGIDRERWRERERKKKRERERERGGGGNATEKIQIRIVLLTVRKFISS